jgi:hypothetical protein
MSFGKLVVGGGFQSDQYQIALADFLRCPGAFWPGIEITFRAMDGHAVAPDGVVIRPQQEMDLLTGVGELCAVITA